MDSKTVKLLCEINNTFYREHYASFSATRTSAWTGWEQCLAAVHEFLPKEVSVFDLACGNLRFENFLTSALPNTTFEFYAVDNCDELVEGDATFLSQAGLPKQKCDKNVASPFAYQNLDVLELLHSEESINSHLAAPLCDLSVSFGFMHHVPSQAYREKVILSLIEQTRSGGFVIVSFWQFLNNEALARKAQATHQQALEELELHGLANELEQNDYLLGWENATGAYRYCHSFTEAEIDQLIEMTAPKAEAISRFVADGRTNNLNTYVVLRTL
ncbi:MAG: class I SAM-dependent methyltransferase [Coriobacteriales bacterium]|nr:class I SAM-dependent methyltransferase [Coriobacteriales bacterium]